MEDPTIIEMFRVQDGKIDLVTKSIDKLESNIKDYFEGAMKVNKANFINEIDPVKRDIRQIVEQNTIRNSRIEKSEIAIDCVDKKVDDKCEQMRRETVFARFIQRHPLATAIMALALIMLGALAVDIYRINVLQSVENASGVVIEKKEMPHNTDN